MKKLKDYEWLCNRYKVRDYILNDRSWKEISRRPLLDAFTSVLIGVYTLKEMGDGLRVLSKATSSKPKTKLVDNFEKSANKSIKIIMLTILTT